MFQRCVLLIAAAAVLLSACELTTTTPTPIEVAAEPTTSEVEPSPTPAPSEAPPATESLPQGTQAPANYNPLTGLLVPDASILERRPVGVKISNYPRSNRPQWGLSLADIVYEYYHNNDLTRFYAIYYGQDASLAGPIRSGRLFDTYLTDIYQSLLVFASADQQVLGRLNAEHPEWQMISLLEGSDCPPRPVCRYNPDGENFLLADTSKAGEFAQARGGDNLRPDLQGMTFTEEPPSGGQSASRIYTYYSYSAYAYWDYDPNSGTYLRYQDTHEAIGTRSEDYMPLVDRLTGSQITTQNVLVLYIPHFHYVYRPATEDEPYGEIVDMDFSGQGTAYLFRDGQAYQVEWVREEGQVLYLVDANGERVPFKPGNTWFQVMNEENRLTTGEGSWTFEFIFRRP